MFKKRKLISEEIEYLINHIIFIYKNVNSDLLINNRFVNMDETLVNKISLRTDSDFYFAFLNAIYEYRDNINANVIPPYQNVAKKRIEICGY